MAARRAVLAGCTAPANTSAKADFTVTVATKTTHPYTGLGFVDGYVVNGVQGMELSLMRGVTYTFAINTSGHPFYLATDPVGGPGAPGEITAGVTGSQTQVGTLTFMPSASTPSLIYYQCAMHQYMGFKIDITG
jgi:hypothetical protein